MGWLEGRVQDQPKETAEPWLHCSSQVTILTILIRLDKAFLILSLIKPFFGRCQRTLGANFFKRRFPHLQGDALPHLFHQLPLPTLPNLPNPALSLFLPLECGAIWGWPGSLHCTLCRHTPRGPPPADAEDATPTAATYPPPPLAPTSFLFLLNQTALGCKFVVVVQSLSHVYSL